MKNKMMSVAEATKLIESGVVAVVAGDEEALRRLPRGKWIGGSSVYFVTEDGGRVDRENLFVTEIEQARDARTVHYSGDAMVRFPEDRFAHGFGVILIPAFSPEHEMFAIQAAEIPGLFDQPLIGWITGVHLDDVGRVTPKVFDGATGTVHARGAVVLHVALAGADVPEIDIVNLFEPDMATDAITFDETGFSARTATVNGRRVELAAYLSQNGIDTALPLVANYAGAMINVSFQSIDGAEGVRFYAPVMAGVEYRIAKGTGDYAASFAERAKGDGRTEMSCNCILNYLYGGLEGRSTGTFSGPATFGEIAYLLVNQTMVRLRITAGQRMAAE